MVLFFREKGAWGNGLMSQLFSPALRAVVGVVDLGWSGAPLRRLQSCSCGKPHADTWRLWLSGKAGRLLVYLYPPEHGGG